MSRSVLMKVEGREGGVQITFSPKGMKWCMVSFQTVLCFWNGLGFREVGEGKIISKKKKLFEKMCPFSFLFPIEVKWKQNVCVCVVLAGISEDMTSVKRLMLYMLLNQLPLKEIVKFFKISIIKPPRGFYENSRKRRHIFPNSVLLVLSSFPYCFFFKEHICPREEDSEHCIRVPHFP